MLFVRQQTKVVESSGGCVDEGDGADAADHGPLHYVPGEAANNVALTFDDEEAVRNRYRPI